jgi:hypothetical protein
MVFKPLHGVSLGRLLSLLELLVLQGAAMGQLLDRQDLASPFLAVHPGISRCFERGTLRYSTHSIGSGMAAVSFTGLRWSA